MSSGDERAAKALGLDVTCGVVHIAVQAIGEDLFRHRWQKASDIGVIGADDTKAVKWDFIEKLPEGGLNLREVPIEIEMFSVNSRHHSDHWTELEKGPIAFVRLCH